MPTILIVDDEPTIRVLLRAALEGAGHRVIEAADGVSALATALRLRPDLILLDVALPGLNGLDVCRRLREDPATAGTPVFLLTGFVQQAERQAAKDVGAHEFVRKPFSPAAVVARIEDTLRTRAGAAPIA